MLTRILVSLLLLAVSFLPSLLARSQLSIATFPGPMRQKAGRGISVVVHFIAKAKSYSVLMLLLLFQGCQSNSQIINNSFSIRILSPFSHFPKECCKIKTNLPKVRHWHRRARNRALVFQWLCCPRPQVAQVSMAFERCMLCSISYPTTVFPAL